MKWGVLVLWSFTANVGDRVVVRVGALTSTNSFNPWLRIYGPNGVLIGDSGINNGNLPVEELALTATNSGTFTVLVSDSQNAFYGGTGAYRLYFGQFPGAFVVPAVYDNDAVTTDINYLALIHPVPLDLWSFTANVGDRVVVRVGA